MKYIFLILLVATLSCRTTALQNTRQDNYFIDTLLNHSSIEPLRKDMMVIHYQNYQSIIRSDNCWLIFRKDKPVYKINRSNPIFLKIEEKHQLLLINYNPYQ